ncbi:transmembrane O-methyltransferase homolog [Paramormyrops kingsleyae]|uniref:transmembrane O-methyltransferase homolog n=1 Tax=Paramormyrops kingsleyae TaxID=1676925 RepID=UPI000CD636C6|nr:transmembrane O-methyltransferase homolog [Paramormyrops kingsleyae]
MHAFVFVNCTHGEAQSVLETFDLYAQAHPSLAIGREKGEYVEEVVRRVAPSQALELGTHCGYSSIRILCALPSSGRLLTVEKDLATADAGEEIILVAGFKNPQFQVLTSPSVEAITHLHSHLGDKLVELVLMDHDVQQYLPELMLLESGGSLATGCVLLANNVHLSGAQSFLDYIRSQPGRYRINSLTQGLLELNWCP